MKNKITVMYLKGLQLFGSKQKQTLLEKALGKENVIVEELNIRSDIITFIIFLLLVVIITFLNVYIAYKFSNNLFTILTVVSSLIVILIMYYIAFHLVHYHIMKKALKRAGKKMIAYNPDVVVGIYFGAVVAMNMDYKMNHKPLILISPSVKAYQKYTQNIEVNLTSFPYILIVNASKDKTNTLASCTKLLSSIQHGKGRIEIIEDNGTYSKLKEEDIKDWVMEANCNSYSAIETLYKTENNFNGKKINIRTQTLNSKIKSIENKSDEHKNKENKHHKKKSKENKEYGKYDPEKEPLV